ncbi:MAG: hypothetical protein V7724_15745 [Sediminicola sp.]
MYLDGDFGEVPATVQWLESVKANGDSNFFSISTVVTHLNRAYFMVRGIDEWTSGLQIMGFQLNVRCT